MILQTNMQANQLKRGITKVELAGKGRGRGAK